MKKFISATILNNYGRNLLGILTDHYLCTGITIQCTRMPRPFDKRQIIIDIYAENRERTKETHYEIISDDEREEEILRGFDEMQLHYLYW